MELVLDMNRRYTYADYLTWTDDKLRELLNGFVRLMSPAPALKHAVVVSRLGNAVFNYIHRRGGKYDRGTVYEGNAQVPVLTLKGLNINTEELFKD
ncbi:MAG: Uma2 family endonuclease [Dysgonamonadaceae bacterium]|jgi:hypothetical protein|nr:Uma2 family endonuclease [Dysgonamonadaceae bacterium]